MGRPENVWKYNKQASRHHRASFSCIANSVADVFETGRVHPIRQRLPGTLHVPHRLDALIVLVAEFVHSVRPDFTV